MNPKFNLNNMTPPTPNPAIPLTLSTFEPHIRPFPYQNTLSFKRILLNTNICSNVIHLIHSLILTGAEITITKADELVAHEPILKHIQENHHFVPFENICQQAYTNYFDLVIDTGGYLANVLKPSIGFVEMNQVENNKYIDTQRPVFSVNDSFVKHIETNFGLGEAFMQCLYKIFDRTYVNILDKNYLIFGYGKVGRAIAHALSQRGIPNNRIFIVDAHDRGVTKAHYDGYTVFNIVTQYKQIKQLLTKIHFAVSATAISGILSRYFTDTDFLHVEHLANMGTYDEWGRRFSSKRILNNKKALNYMLEEPIAMQFLIPMYSLTIETCIFAAEQPYEKTFKIIPAPKIAQLPIIESWLQRSTHMYTWDSIQRVVGEEITYLNHFIDKQKQLSI